MASGSSRFQVIIVGGSIAGLTLAHCLHKAGIRYVLLEKRKEIAPQEGASIAIMPNGARILEQLGVYSAIEPLIEPLQTATFSHPGGFSYRSGLSTYLHRRFGYPIGFLDRQKVLQILHASLPDQSNVHVNKKVVRIDNQQKSGTRVYTDDGGFIDGDLVVGADGIHSRVRQEMWRIADSQQPGVITDHEKESIRGKYVCIFGISSQVSGLKGCDQIFRVGNGWSVMMVNGKNGRLYWFLFQKLDREFTHGRAPRFSAEDAVTRCQKLADETIWGNVEFRAIWQKREAFSITTIEENVLQTWNWGRIVCIGDSVHKLNPNIGQGANYAIEDAALLSSLLYKCLAVKGHARHAADYNIGTDLQKFRDLSIARVRETCEAGKRVIALNARDGLSNMLIGRYLMQYMDNLAITYATKTILDAPFVDFLSLPERSIPGCFRSQDTHTTLWFKVVVGFLVVGMCTSYLNFVFLGG